MRLDRLEEAIKEYRKRLQARTYEKINTKRDLADIRNTVVDFFVEYCQLYNNANQAIVNQTLDAEKRISSLNNYKKETMKMVESIRTLPKYKEVEEWLRNPACKNPEFNRGYYACMQDILYILRSDEDQDKNHPDLY